MGKRRNGQNKQTLGVVNTPISAPSNVELILGKRPARKVNRTRSSQIRPISLFWFTHQSELVDILATMPHARGRCASCHGTGRCPDCKGNGSTLVLRCVMCLGSGKCERCGGMVTRSDESPLDWLRSLVRRLQGKPPFEGL
jgi:hypothetical protein